MRLRHKLFILLATIALLPLIVTGLLSRSNLRTCSIGLASDTRESVSQIVDQARIRLVKQYAAILDRDRVITESAVRAAANELERIDAEGTTGDPQQPTFYTAADFDDPARRPPGLISDESQFVQNADGSRAPILYSNDIPVFVPPPGADPAEVLADQQMLVGLVPLMKAQRSETGSILRYRSQYAALDNSGTLMSLPGKGGYPKAYDARQRPWFINAAKSESPATWIVPVVDAPTGQVRMTCAAPARRDDGSLIGVAAVDLLMLDLLEEIDLPPALAGRVQIMLVNLEDGGPVVLAKADYASKGGSWLAPIELDRFSTDSEQETDRLVELMRSSPDGSLDVTMSGQPWIVTYQSLYGSDSFVIVGIAREAIDAVANNVQNEVYRVFNQTLTSNASVGAAVVMIAILAAFYGSKSVTRPISKLAETATELAEGNLEARAEVNTGDELETLADAFNDMVPKLKDQIHVRESLQLAKEVQQNLLPQSPPSVPGFDIAARSIYCDETGGDYFDFITLEQPSRCAVVIGDVTGHGIAAALLMTTARALLRSHADDPDALPAILHKVNHNLARDARPGQFMTLYFLTIEPEAGVMRWVSAGHDAAVVYRPGSDDFTEFAGNDIPLGVEPEWDFHEYTSPIPEPGAVAVLGTDGIWEARNPEGEMYGKDRLRDVIRRGAGSDADTIAQAIISDVVRFRRSSPQTDDITLVVLRTTGHPGSGVSQTT